jgi:hypothetical protein
MSEPRQGAQQLAVVADDSHLGAFHPQGDALASQLVAHAELGAGQAYQAGAVLGRVTMSRVFRS